MKMWMMPKIDFLSSEHGNIAKVCGFFIGDTADKDEIIIWGNGTRYEIKLKENQTFEQAVTEWVQNWIKDNFEPIVVPDEFPMNKFIDPTLYKPEHLGRISGYNSFRGMLLSLNPNAIVEDV